MSFKNTLSDFAGALTTAINYALNGYPTWSSWTYENNMADLSELWACIRPKLRDMGQADFIDAKLKEAFAAFEANEKDKGRDAILAIYNLGVKQLR
jgi:hypothetical protein